MLRFLRRNARSWIMYIILGIIIFVFVLYFGSNRASRTAQAIALIDERVITEGEFEEEYRKLLDMARMQYGGNLTSEAIKKMGLKKMAYDSLLNRQIIISKAADLKVQVSDEELRNMIMASPALQTDGKFDERKYQQMLRYNRTSAEDFENMQKVHVTAGKIEALIREGIKISDQEIFDVYAMQNQKINLSFVQVSGKDIKKKIVPTEAELENYLKSNSSQFRRAEQVKINYLSFPGLNYAPGDVSDTDCNDYYNRNKEKYKTKDGKQLPLKDVRPSVVKELMKMRGMQTAYTEAKKAHDTIYQEENFEAFAAQNKLKINNMDFFPVSKSPQEFVSVKDFAETLAGLQKNEISRVLKADDGYYIIKVTDKKAAYLPQLKEIKGEVEKQFIESEVNSLAEKEAARILEQLKKGEKLDKAAKGAGLKINETGLFQPGNVIPKVGANREATEALIQLTAAKPHPDKPFLINNSYLVFEFKEAGNVDKKDFEAQKDLYKKLLLSLKREEVMQTWLDGNRQTMEKEGRIKIKKDIKDL